MGRRRLSELHEAFPLAPGSRWRNRDTDRVDVVMRVVFDTHVTFRKARGGTATVRLEQFHATHVPAEPVILTFS